MTAAPPEVEIRLLGPVRARRHGVELPPGPARARAVLTVLAVHAGRPVTRDELVRAVWGDNAPAGATGNLYTYVSALRRALEPDRARWSAARLLTSGGGSYCLHLPGEANDEARFETLCAAARQHRADGDAHGELAALARARALWRGEALDGVPGPFAAAQRARLTELLRAVSDRYATLTDAAGRAAGPVVETPAMAVRVRDDRPAAGPGRLVGRDAHLDRLTAAVTDVARGRGAALWITGEPGSGKSRLLAEGLRGATTAGARAGWGTGDDLAGRTPLGLLLDCLETAAADRDVHAVVRRIRPAGAAGLDRALAVVRDICAAAPLVLAADDLHRADDATLRAWRALRSLARELPLLLVATYRPGPHPGPAGPGAETLHLAPLPDAEAAELVRRTAPGHPPAEVRAIVAEAGGNPSYLELLAAGRTAALSAAVDAHLDRFGAPARQALRMLAFRGPSTVAELAAATGRPDPALRAAVAAGVLTAGPDGRWWFRHPVVARVLHDGTPAPLRAVLHREFGDSGGFRYPVAARAVSSARG